MAQVLARTAGKAHINTSPAQLISLFVLDFELLQGTEVPVMTPDGAGFSFLVLVCFCFCLGRPK